MNLPSRVMTQCDILDREAWHEAMDLFDDASIYQTWDFVQVVSRGRQVSRIVARVADRIVCMAQARIVTVPVLKRGVAYVFRGPLWRVRDTQDAEGFKAAVAACKEEFAGRRRLLLRLAPSVSSDNQDARRVLIEAGFVRTSLRPYGTITVNIARPLDDIRKGFAQKWRNCLNRSERNGLELASGSNRSLYDEFLAMYDEMMARKSFDTGVDPHQWASLFEALPERFGLSVLLARKDGECVAGMVFSLIGDTGIYLLGATSDAGLSLKGSYLLQWRAIQMMKDAGCKAYDLGGIDPEGNPGVYHFKSGLGGREMSFIGTYEYCESALSRTLVDFGERLRRVKRHFCQRVPRSRR